MRSVFLCVALGAAVCPAQTQGVAADVAFLRREVTRLPKTGVPGALVVFGKDAFAVVTAVGDGADYPVVAAAHHGKGRAVVVGHGGLWGDGGSGAAAEDVARFQRNALRWAAGGMERRVSLAPRLVLIGRGGGGLVRRSQEMGFGDTVRDLDEARASDVLFLTDNRTLSGAEVERVLGLVSAGAGLLAAGPGWGWMQLNPKGDLASDHGANQVLLPMGLMVADGTVGRPRPTAGWRTCTPAASRRCCCGTVRVHCRTGARGVAGGRSGRRP